MLTDDRRWSVRQINKRRVSKGTCNQAVDEEPCVLLVTVVFFSSHKLLENVMV